MKRHKGERSRFVAGVRVLISIDSISLTRIFIEWKTSRVDQYPQKLGTQTGSSGTSFWSPEVEFAVVATRNCIPENNLLATPAILPSQNVGKNSICCDDRV